MRYTTVEYRYLNVTNTKINRIINARDCFFLQWRRNVLVFTYIGIFKYDSVVHWVTVIDT